MLKLSDETCREPEHVVFEVLVVTVVVSIASEKVTDVVVVRPAVAESAGEDEETVGAVVSVVVVSVSGSCVVSGTSCRILLFIITTGDDGETKKGYENYG